MQQPNPSDRRSWPKRDTDKWRWHRPRHQRRPHRWWNYRAQVAFVTGGTNNGDTNTTASITISPSTTGGVGHDLFVSVTLPTLTATVSSITSTGGSATFKKISSVSNAGHVELWAAINIGAGITSITVNFTSSKFSIAV